MYHWLSEQFRRRSSKRLRAHAQDAQRQANWQHAEQLYRQLLDHCPQDANAAFGIAGALYQQQRLTEAHAAIETAITLKGNIADFHYLLGNIHADLGHQEQAAACYRQALVCDPMHAQASNNLGIYCEAQGLDPEAEQYYRTAIGAAPGLFEAHRNLAWLLFRLGNKDEAESLIHTFITAHPVNADAWYLLGEFYARSGRNDKAVKCHRQAFTLNPDNNEFAYGLCLVLIAAHETDQAEQIATHLIDTCPGNPNGWLLRGKIAETLEQTGKVIQICQEGLTRFPDHIGLLSNLSAQHIRNDQLDEALACLARITTTPDGAAFEPAWLNQGTALLRLGDTAGAIAAYQRAVELNPADAEAARHILVALSYQTTPETVRFQAHIAFGARYAGLPLKVAGLPTESQPRKLRIGYLSSDFRQHPVAFNMQPIFQHHDRTQFDIYLYSCSDKQDKITDWFRGQANAWRPMQGMSDADIALAIRSDQIDLLVILAGHFDSNRLLVASYRAAPIQISMHDPATSGLWAMDYLIADKRLAPKHTPEYFTEEVFHLPTFYLHPPLEPSPPVGPLPMLSRSGVTFGSFNNPAKITDETLKMWAGVLHACPGSRLMLRYWAVLGVPSLQTRYRKTFEAAGVAFDRVELVESGRDHRQSHLDHYNEIDIALDPYPFTGSTTTFEALWMGVPVITLAGPNMASRWSMGILGKVGLSRCIADTPAAYIAAAEHLASQPNELTRIRQTLRNRVSQSPLCASEKRTRQLERAYRWMWARHLARQHVPQAHSD